MINGQPLDSSFGDAVRRLAVNNGDGFNAIVAEVEAEMGGWVATIDVVSIPLVGDPITGGSISYPPPPVIIDGPRVWHLTSVVLTPSPLATYTEQDT